MNGWTTEDYRNSIGDTKNPDFFSLGYQWADKKHRHVYQLCDWVDDLNRQLAERDKEISELHDTASEQRGELSELERDYAHQRELLTDARATIARQSEVLKKAWEALKGVIRVADRSTTEFDAARAAVLAIDEALK